MLYKIVNMYIITVFYWKYIINDLEILQKENPKRS